MKRFTVWIFIIGATAALMISCAPAVTPAGPLTLTGTISVPDVSYWTSIKIGMIAIPTNNDGSPASDLSKTSFGGVTYSNRIYLWHNSDNSTNNFKPTYFGSITGSGTLKDYAITISTWDDSKAFYFVAWYDKNLDSNLNLIDAGGGGDADNTNSEINTCAWKQLSTERAQISTVFSSMSGGQQMYKFNGNSSNTTYLYQEIKTDMKSGFNFYLITNVWTIN
ncbi:MAG: hypothetical protein HPY53_07030 [Brevinematales bacterium]|nr:hypothetical protein [Brevinematales bacterium]